MEMADPKDNPPSILYVHEHDGIRYPGIVATSSLKALRTFHVREDDVWLLSFPKSGTHWLLEIIGLIRANGDPDKVDRSSNSPVEMINLNQRFPMSKEDEEENPLDLTPFLHTAENAPSPRFLFTHVLPHLVPQDLLKAKVVYLARNPKDLATSWHNFVGHNPANPTTWDDYLTEFMEEKNLWGSWFEHVHTFWKLRNHPNVLFLTYEDLLQDPTKYIAQIAQHVGRSLSDSEIQCLVANSTMSSMKKTYKKMEKNGVVMPVKAAGKFAYLHTGVIGRWKNRFSIKQNIAFEEWYQKKIIDTDLSMTFE